MSARPNRRRFLSTVTGLFAVAVPDRWVNPDCASAFQEVCAEVDELYYDRHGFIVQRDCDGGDTAQREGMYWLGNWVRMHSPDLSSLGATPESRRYGRVRNVTFGQVMDLLEEPGQTGRFRRHPTQTTLIGEPPFRGPMNDPVTTSRDQVLPLVAAMGVHRDAARLARFHERVKRDKYILNRDVMLAFEEFFKRAREHDLLLGGTVDRTILDKAVDLRLDEIKTNGMDDVGDDLNLIVQLLLAAVRNGDQIKAVRARYASERPKNYGVYLTTYRAAFPKDFSANKQTMIDRINTGVAKHGWKPDCTSVLGALRWYFRRETGGGPGLAQLYRPILDIYFSAPIPT